MPDRARLASRVEPDRLSSETDVKSWLILACTGKASFPMEALRIGADAERTIDESDFLIRGSFSQKCRASHFPLFSHELMP
ncbi:MAG: hypothetical protein MUF11_02070 [Beijerinckiaceae bacterium]|nr:hypothetical protein [Beijerinckiaceae bacterium]